MHVSKFYFLTTFLWFFFLNVLSYLLNLRIKVHDIIFIFKFLKQLLWKWTRPEGKKWTQKKNGTVHGFVLLYGLWLPQWIAQVIIGLLSRLLWKAQSVHDAAGHRSSPNSESLSTPQAGFHFFFLITWDYCSDYNSYYMRI